jgi:hypothetical protein
MRISHQKGSTGMNHHHHHHHHHHHLLLFFFFFFFFFTLWIKPMAYAGFKMSTVLLVASPCRSVLKGLL